MGYNSSRKNDREIQRILIAHHSDTIFCMIIKYYYP